MWEVVGSAEVNHDVALKKWKTKTGKTMYAIKTTTEEDMLVYIRIAESPKKKIKIVKTMFVIKTTIEEDMLEHIRRVESPKEMRNTFVYHPWDQP